MNMMSLRQASPRTKAGAKWLSKVKKGHMSKGKFRLKLSHQIENYCYVERRNEIRVLIWNHSINFLKHSNLFLAEAVTFSVVHLSPLGSQAELSSSHNLTTRIENVVDWDAIAKKYRSLNGNELEETSNSFKESENESKSNTAETKLAAA